MLDNLEMGFNSLFGVGFMETTEKIINDDRNYVTMPTDRIIKKAKNRTFKKKSKRKRIILKEIYFIPSYGFDFVG